MGVDGRYCLAVPDIYYNGGEICGIIEDNPVQVGERTCYSGNSPELYSVDATLLSENLGPASFSFGFWAGIEVSQSSNELCLWIGNEDYEICVKECTTPDEIKSAEFVGRVAGDFVDQLAEETDNSIIDLIGSIILAVIVAIVLAIISAIASQFGVAA